MGDDTFRAINELKKERKIKARLRNRENFNKFFKDKEIYILKEYNNILEFEFNNSIFYFAETTNLIRHKGTKDWEKFKLWINGK